MTYETQEIEPTYVIRLSIQWTSYPCEAYPYTYRCCWINRTVNTAGGLSESFIRDLQPSTRVYRCWLTTYTSRRPSFPPQAGSTTNILHQNCMAEVANQKSGWKLPIFSHLYEVERLRSEIQWHLATFKRWASSTGRLKLLSKQTDPNPNPETERLLKGKLAS